MVWCGAVRCGVVCYGVLCSSVLWYGMVLHGTVWCAMVWYGIDIGVGIGIGMGMGIGMMTGMGWHGDRDETRDADGGRCVDQDRGSGFTCVVSAATCKPGLCAHLAHSTSRSQQRVRRLPSLAHKPPREHDSQQHHDVSRS